MKTMEREIIFYGDRKQVERLSKTVAKYLCTTPTVKQYAKFMELYEKYKQE